MILSSDEIEVLEYLKAYNGNCVSLVQICRSAGGRQKFRESPHWARRLMSRLVDEKLIEVNERGHYSYKLPVAVTAGPAASAAPQAPDPENYFVPADEAEPTQIVGDDYFSPMEPMPPIKAKKQWVSPHIEGILKKAGKKPPTYPHHD